MQSSALLPFQTRSDDLCETSKCVSLKLCAADWTLEEDRRPRHTEVHLCSAAAVEEEMNVNPCL